MSHTGRPISPAKVITQIVDHDLRDDFKLWMVQNNFGPGEEIIALRMAVRLALSSSPITAWLAEAKARVGEHCRVELLRKIYDALREITREYEQAIKGTSPEEITFGRQE